jgi:isopentenyl diphosphate isomerase/L-lactate dehydrogenase-like FMN-dependent dehydrogenase
MERWKRISGGRPFCLKGIQSVEDAKKAVEMYVTLELSDAGSLTDLRVEELTASSCRTMLADRLMAL